MAPEALLMGFAGLRGPPRPAQIMPSRGRGVGLVNLCDRSGITTVLDDDRVVAQLHDLSNFSVGLCLKLTSREICYCACAVDLDCGHIVSPCRLLRGVKRPEPNASALQAHVPDLGCIPPPRPLPDPTVHARVSGQGVSLCGPALGGCRRLPGMLVDTRHRHDKAVFSHQMPWTPAIQTSQQTIA
eukprot:scaffold42541_cov36-Prasinocladus_malaysianus.AAC.1